VPIFAGTTGGLDMDASQKADMPPYPKTDPIPVW
jgi:hypothetical protein